MDPSTAGMQPEAAGTRDGVTRLVEAYFGCVPQSIERKSYGHSSVTFAVELPGQGLIVRCHPEPQFYEGTLRNLAVLRSLGIPVPNVLVVDFSRKYVPYAVLIMERFVGRDLGFVLSEMTLSQMTILAEQVVIFERAAASLPLGNGFGFVPEGAKGASSWFEVVQADRGRFSAPEGSPPEVIEVIEGARLALQASRDRLGTVKPVCFLDDLTTKNVIVHEGRLSGVVDFDVVCYGDPMYWLALTRVAVLSDVGSAGWFYVEELQRIWGPNERDLQNLNLYSALHAAAFITYDLADRDRLGRLIEAVHQWL